jgi:Carboxypeptidase regulatory-like domain
MSKLFDPRARTLGLILLLAALVSSGYRPALLAQQVFGSIYGTVTDNSGAAVSRAKITITDLSKNTRFETITNDTGNYEKGQLIPGTYRVDVEAPGFSTVSSTAIQVSVDQAARFDVTLKVGTVQEQVQVTAEAPLLQTDRADIAQTYTAKEISELPNFGRNVQSFELLTPGTTQFGWQQNNAENPQGGVMINVNGQPWSASDFDLDGTTNQDPILGIIIINPTMDSVNEVKQATQEFDAEFGYAGGGHMSYSTKSGTNSFHGSAFEYIYLNTPGFQDFGRNPFNAAENERVPPVRWNQFGGSIGGPIIRNKLFFFGDAQLTRTSQGSSIQTSVPTAAARGGDLSAYINNGQNIVYDPLTGNQQTGVGRTAFPNNVIPTDRISPQATAILSYLPCRIQSSQPAA